MPPVSDRTKLILGAAFWLIAMAVQFSDFHSTPIGSLFAIGGAGFLVWAFIHHARECHRIGKRLVEPRHIILMGIVGAAVCLLLAAGGYIWLLRTTATAAPDKQGAATPSTPLATASSSPNITFGADKTYSTSEKNELLDATRQIVKLVDGDGEVVAHNINDVFHAWDVIYNSRNLTTIPELIKRLDILENSANALHDHFMARPNTVLYPYNSYSRELEFVLQLPKEWQRDPLANLAGVTTKFRDNVIAIESSIATDDPELIGKILNLGIGVPQLQEAQKRYLDWRRDIKIRAEQLRVNVL
jgi:hypothetical protein